MYNAEKHFTFYPKLKFKNKRQERYYYKLVRDVKKTLPLAKEIKRAVIETYEYMETLPNQKAKEQHMKMVEKGLKEQYTARMKKTDFFTKVSCLSTGEPGMQPIVLPAGEGFHGTF